MKETIWQPIQNYSIGGFKMISCRKNKFVAVLNLSISFLDDWSTSFFSALDKDFYDHMQTIADGRIVLFSTMYSSCVQILSKRWALKCVIFTSLKCFPLSVCHQRALCHRIPLVSYWRARNNAVQLRRDCLDSFSCFYVHLVWLGFLSFQSVNTWEGIVAF